MAGATDRQRTSAAVDLETVAFVASLLVFVGGAIALVAGIGTGVLLLVSLFATRRAAEDDDLDRDFEQR